MPNERLAIRAREIAHAIALGTAIDADARAADAVTAGYLRAHPDLAGPSRGAVLELTSAILRRRALLDWWIEGTRLGLPPTPRARVLAHLVLFESRTPGAIARVFTGRPDTAAPPGGREQALIEALQGKQPLDLAVPPAVRYGVPDWLEPRLRAAFGDRFGIEMAALAEDAPLDLRANRLKTDRDGARKALAREGLKALPAPLSPLGLRLDHGIDLGKCQALMEGLVEPQDEGSQIAALLVEARPGMYVVDYCAGAGGKTLVLAGAMQGRGRLIAGDVSAKRLERARQRFRRAGANVETRETTDRKWFKRQRGRADRVLVDAPCTGIGAWRRVPDARWRLKPEDVPELVAKQAKILDQAAALVAAGGRLVYVTCSLLAEENEDQVAAFLARHPDFRVLPIGEIWAATLKAPCPAEGDMLTLTPARHGTGGFFIAVLERVRAAEGDAADED
ncbi:RsmB/NOP family class I SAM-dependent RNA methyltransferase [Desertibaculum subflavum]|uniref:RsmB/NOP family class I SAM-dependent RNA methyltransferase n=1 Tax=Desertibaculum subflavum TaxID=2268458 RepID=UPI0034D1961A